MTNFFARFLRFTRLIDDGMISLTNIAVIVSIVRLVVASRIGFADVGVLFLALALYAFGSVLSERRSDRASQTSTALDLATKAHEAALSTAENVKRLTDRVTAIDNRTATPRPLR